MLLQSWVVRAGTDDRDNTTTAPAIVEKSRVNGSRADPGIRTIYGSLDAVRWVCRAADQTRGVANALVAKVIKFLHDQTCAAGGTPKSERRIFKRPPIVAV